jgi:hypothetical protein
MAMVAIESTIEDKIMNTYKLSIPLHMNMDYVRLIMAKFEETKAINLAEDVLEAEIYDDEAPDSLCSQLDNLWCSKSPEGSVGFADFLQTFGAVEPNPFVRGDEDEPTTCLYDQLDADQQALYVCIDMDIAEFDGKLSYQKIIEVLLAQLQPIEDQ